MKNIFRYFIIRFPTLIPTDFVNMVRYFFSGCDDGKLVG